MDLSPIRLIKTKQLAVKEGKFTSCRVSMKTEMFQRLAQPAQKAQRRAPRGVRQTAKGHSLSDDLEVHHKDGGI